MLKADLSKNTRAVQSFQQAIEGCTLPHVPQATRQVILTDAWRDRFEMGRRIQFDDFVEFVTREPAKGGCGLKPEKVTDLLEKAGDTEALNMWLRAIRAKKARKIDAQTPDLKAPGQHGSLGNKNRATKAHIPMDNTAAYALARLRKDRPAIHARVLAGEITAHAGMVEAGFRKKQTKGRKMEKLFSACAMQPVQDDDENYGELIVCRCVRCNRVAWRQKDGDVACLVCLHEMTKSNAL
jgi:hypothetical protein